jgi:hypothetical protein
MTMTKRSGDKGSLALDLWSSQKKNTGAAINKNGKPSCGNTKFYPMPPFLRETTTSKQIQKELPTHMIIGLPTSNLHRTPRSPYFNIESKYSYAMRTKSKI